MAYSSPLSRKLDDLGIRAEFAYGAALETRSWGAHNWRVTLTRRVKGGGRRQITVDFFGGDRVTNPSAADVVSSLALDARCGLDTWADYCAEQGIEADLGDDPDEADVNELIEQYGKEAVQSLLVWKACRKIAPRIVRFLGDDYDAVVNAEH